MGSCNESLPDLPDLPEIPDLSYQPDLPHLTYQPDLLLITILTKFLEEEEKSGGVDDGLMQ